MGVRMRFLVVLFLITAACNPQVKDGEKVYIRNKATGTVTDQGATVKIDSGSEVTIQPGALAVGANVTVAKAETPSEFSSTGLSSGSSAVDISGTSPTGEALTVATSPMTIALSVDGGASLALKPEANADQLCVVLKAKAGGLYVWRRSGINYEDAAKKASVQSLHFGTYQVVYCGAEPLSGFNDASLAGITGEDKATLEVSIPSRYKSQYGAAKVCYFAFRHARTSDEACRGSLRPGCVKSSLILAATESDLSSTDTTTLKIEVPSTTITSGYAYYSGVAFLEEGGGCPAKVGESLGEGSELTKLKILAAVEQSDSAIKAGYKAEYGKEKPFTTETLNLQLGGPGSLANWAKFDESQVCMIYEHQGTHVLSFLGFANGAISGTSGQGLEVPIKAGEGSAFALGFKVGGTCKLENTVTSSFSTAKPNLALFVATTTPYYLVPVTMSFSHSSNLTQSLNGCLDLYLPGGDVKVGSIGMALGGGPYKLYIPYLADAAYQVNGVPKYDMKVTILTAGSDCIKRESTLPKVDLTNKVLTENITISL